MELAHQLKAQAHQLGFQLVGITSPDPPAHLDVYQDWLGAGRHGEMAYLESVERRGNPRLLLPSCRSILVLGTLYRPEVVPHHPGRVAAYALGEDYHEVLNQRASDLVHFLQRETGESIEHRIYSDTGPLLERELAQRAGLGWIGKNTCLISPKEGSHLFLTEVLLAIELPFDSPFRSDHCGSCRRCIEACPTDCILEDRTLDASRCISYLTIELQGPLPDKLRSQMGDWIFGCDICQDVCPWNLRFGASSQDPAFQARDFLQNAGPIEFLELDQDAYRAHLRRSPLKRPKLHGLRRNAAVAAGNLKLEAATGSLEALLKGGAGAAERSHAAWALGKIGGEAADAALRGALDSEQDPEVQAAIRHAIADAAT